MPVTFSTMFSRFPSRNTYLQYQPSSLFLIIHIKPTQVHREIRLCFKTCAAVKPRRPQLHLGLAAGLALAALTSVFLAASGAHVSPAVCSNFPSNLLLLLFRIIFSRAFLLERLLTTVPIRYSADFPPLIVQVCLAAALLHRISPLRALAMAIAQCGGAIAAAALVLAITGIAR